MSQIRLKYIKSYTDRTGVVRRYFNKAGQPAVALPGAPGSAEFMAAYQGALHGAGLSRPPARPAPAPDAGSINALAAAYYASAAFKTLGPTTKTTYRGMISSVQRDHGDKPVALLDRKGVRKLVDAMADRPAAANKMLRTLKMLMRFAVEDEWRIDDPTALVKSLKVKGDGFVAWREEDIAAFERRHPVGTRPRLALALLLYTAQRRGDVVRMGWQHVRGDMIAVRQEKTGTALEVPMHADLAAILRVTPKENLTFLLTGYGKPFSPAGFGNWFRERAAEAGLPLGYNAHGLRKAAARRLAEAGATTREIMAMTGHADIEEVERYTRAASQQTLARSAISKLKLSNGR